MTTEAIEQFELNGRTFHVLWQESAAYLRADGRFWGGSLGAGLSPEQARRQARLRALFMVEQERQHELELLPQFYHSNPSARAARLRRDYQRLALTLGEATYPVVWAPFNRNLYVCLAEGWRFVASAAEQDEACARVRAFLELLPAPTRHPGRPDQAPTETSPAARMIDAVTGAERPSAAQARCWLAATIVILALVSLGWAGL